MNMPASTYDKIEPFSTLLTIKDIFVIILLLLYTDIDMERGREIERDTEK